LQRPIVDKAANILHGKSDVVFKDKIAGWGNMQIPHWAGCRQ